MNSLYFNPTAFVDNLSYMGVGMLGVFLIIGIIVAATSLLKTFTTKKNSKDE
jgi:hypothetical protein